MTRADSGLRARRADRVARSMASSAASSTDSRRRLAPDAYPGTGGGLGAVAGQRQHRQVGDGAAAARRGCPRSTPPPIHPSRRRRSRCGRRGPGGRASCRRLLELDGELHLLVDVVGGDPVRHRSRSAVGDAVRLGEAGVLVGFREARRCRAPPSSVAATISGSSVPAQANPGRWSRMTRMPTPAEPAWVSDSTSPS